MMQRRWEMRKERSREKEGKERDEALRGSVKGKWIAQVEEL